VEPDEAKAEPDTHLDEHWQQAGKVFGKAVQTHERMKWLEGTALRAWAALAVGGLSLASLILDSRALKLSAASLGVALPAAWLLLRGWWRLQTKLVNRHANRGRP
jgi:hypothetical protein